MKIPTSNAQVDQMRKLIFLEIAAVGILSLAPSLRAEETTQTSCPICRSANNQSAPYPQKASSTLVRGALNTFFGWTELLVEPTEEVKEGGNLAVGIGKGAGLAAKRTFLGVGEVLTFWIPKGQHGSPSLNTTCPICMGAHPKPQPSEQHPQH